jgi:2-hydroxy-3-keto-5-methylthiopentenyl-1-phosphate phosphatase
MLNECIKKNKIYFRFGVKKFFDIIIKFKLPLILISGGIKEIIIMEIVELIGNEKYNFLIDNNLLFIIANSFIFKNENNNLNNNFNNENNLNNENNNVIDYKKPIVYTFYKNLSVDKLLKELKLNELKLNILFMGDNLNDIDAIKDINFEEKKSIFFYNKEIENFPEKECFKKYDVAILNDGDFEIVNEILLNNFNL